MTSGYSNSETKEGASKHKYFEFGLNSILNYTIKRKGMKS